MIEKYKQLLMRDLCARLPYGVKLQLENWESPITLIAINQLYGIIVDGINPYPVEAFKPYLFPLSSITEEQVKEFNNLCNTVSYGIFIHKYQRVTLCDNLDNSFSYNYTDIHDWLICINWLYKHHFDINNLIRKGLAIDATNLNIY